MFCPCGSVDRQRRLAMLFLLLRTVVVGVLVGVVTSEATPVESDTQAMIYLSQFGYLPPTVRNRGTIMSEDTMKKAVAEFQAFAGLNITGEIDHETAHTMSLPRCGVKDKVGYGTDSRSKRYALQGSRWRVKALTYRISKYPSTSRINKEDVDKELNNAFNVWAGVTDLSFTQKDSGQVHIEIRFEKGEHGDGDPFDGPGGTLAHAYFPVYGGDAHFDDAETWTIQSYRGTNLFQVAAHEFGHSLGLSHSDVKSALMAPFYRGYEPIFKLDQDDVQGIQALYGKKSKGGSDDHTTSSTTEQSGRDGEGVDSEEDPILCKDGSVDTMFNSAEGVTYVFKGDNYWKLTADGVAANYPRLIARSWKGLPGDMDAAFTYRNGKTYFFKGDQYWRYIGKKMDGEYPKPISEGFTGIPDNLDAAMVWGGNGKIYFYKGSKFWRFDPSQRPPVKSTYPKPISNWEGIPDNVDAALQYTNGYTYFFKGNAYYRFNDRTFAVDTADPAFPRSAGHWWFGCATQTSGTYKPGNRPGFSWYTHSGEDEGAVAVDNNEQRDRADSHDSDVDDLILDAGDEQISDIPRDQRSLASDSYRSRPVFAQLLVASLAALAALRRWT